MYRLSECIHEYQAIQHRIGQRIIRIILQLWGLHPKCHVIYMSIDAAYLIEAVGLSRSFVGTL
jgi:hypothetical protein